MLWTAPDGWGNLGGGIICSTIRKITCEKCSKSRIGKEVKKKPPTIRCCEQHLMVGLIWGGIICSTIRKITCEKCSKSRIGEEIQKKKKPNHQMLWTAPDGLG